MDDTCDHVVTRGKDVRYRAPVPVPIGSTETTRAHLGWESIQIPVLLKKIQLRLLRVARTIRDCLRGGRMNDLPELIRKGRDRYAMQLFYQHLLDRVNTGKVSMETAIDASLNPEEFERTLRLE